MRRYLIFLLCVILSISLLTVHAEEAEVWSNPFSDVSEEMWFYNAVASLNNMGIIESSDKFNPQKNETRGGVVNYLYSMYIAEGNKFSSKEKCTFSDVDETDKYYDAICWAYENGIATGTSKNLFEPDKKITREQVATFVIRYAENFGIKLRRSSEPTQFKDSLDIKGYARSAVVACKMASVLKGYENGYFYPNRTIKKAEIASLIYNFIKATKLDVPKGESVSTASGEYDSLYDSYISAFEAHVKKSSAVDVSYFNNCALVGDSVTLSLKNYCAATGELGDAVFLCAGSMSARNALMPLGSKDAIHPSYKGVKMTVEDAVLKSGVDKVYIMLGMNGISFGIENEINNIITLVGRIKEKSPDVKILIQSVTPMAKGSNISGAKLNNTKIAQYNERLKQVCEENKWYYIHIAEAVTGADGYLRKEYCSDASGMGIHFTKTGDQVWIEYLKTHVPEELK